MSNFNPLDYPICLRHPLRISLTSWMEHVPFAMFLVHLTRPKVLVELGTFYGVSYCAFCQAVKELGTDTRCYAIDTWEGDAQAGLLGPEALEDLKGHHDPLYGSFSRLIQSTFDETLQYFDDGSIDLLHIDGFHTYDAVKRDFDNWLPKMSQQGVILFHDINVRERNFGVWKLWQDLKVSYPHFEIIHGHGLGLLVVGQHCPELLRGLLKSSEEELALLRDFFYQLGARLESVRVIYEQRRLIKEQDDIIIRLQRFEQLWTARLHRLLLDEGLAGIIRKCATKFRSKTSQDTETERKSIVENGAKEVTSLNT